MFGRKKRREQREEREAHEDPFRALTFLERQRLLEEKYQTLADIERRKAFVNHAPPVSVTKPPFSNEWTSNEWTSPVVSSEFRIMGTVTSRSELAGKSKEAHEGDMWVTGDGSAVVWHNRRWTEAGKIRDFADTTVDVPEGEKFKFDGF